MATVRPTAVAGLFYPDDPAELTSMVEGFLGAAPADGPAPKAVIAPHAGYVYSGPIAGSAFRAVASAAGTIRRVILLGPSHFVPIHGLALPGDGRFSTPLGEIRIEPEGCQAAIRLPQVRVIPEAHAREHALEVELPFLQTLLGEFDLVPLVVGQASGEEIAEVLDRLWGGPETLVVISSDLSHYLSYEAARRADRETADAILALKGPLHSRQACGAAPINGLLTAARRRGMRAELLDLRNSADTAGDPSRVVGYGVFAFHE
ncbi:MAG TPA: AmmeMemoRadiSam system protein B [Thermoanaerobaculia bacterium]